MFKSFKILLTGGIGDCIYILSYVFPIQSFYEQNKDIKIFISYGGDNDCGHIDTIKDFCQRLHFVKWVDENNFNHCDAIEFNYKKNFTPEIHKFLTDHKPTPLKFYLYLKEIDFYFNKVGKKEYVFIQLSSNSPQRIWNKSNYEELIIWILENTHYNIVLSDWKWSKGLNIESPRIISAIGSDVSFASFLIGKASLVISTCSWNKYVATLYKKKRIILCADVSEMLGYSDIEKCINDIFGPVIISDGYKLLGITSEMKDNRFINPKIVKHVNEIKIEEVINAIRELQ